MLLHSLWQGLLLGIVAGAVIVFTRKSSSAIRYNILSALFFLFILLTCFTFVRQLQIASGETGVAKITNQNTVNSHGDIKNIVVTGENLRSENFQDYIDNAISYFNRNAAWIVMIWFIIFCAQFVKLLANLGYVQRIRHYRVHATNAYWAGQMNILAERLHIKKAIRLLESEIVKVPTTAGFLKPVILFPISLLSQLPPEQVEAILLHELAHIKRRDYFVNLLQSFAEIIFFFNPAVLWVSSIMRDERENCCDDIAIKQINSKEKLINALVNFQEYNLSGSKYAMAFPGQKNHLFNRIKRIVTNNNKTLNNMEKIVLASALLIAGAMTVVLGQTHRPIKNETPKPPAIAVTPPMPPSANGSSSTLIIRDVAKNTEPVKADILASTPEPPFPPIFAPVVASDTLPHQYEEHDGPAYLHGIFDRTVDGKKYELVYVRNKLTELYVDEKRVPDSKIVNYNSVIKEIVEEIKSESEVMAEKEKLARDYADNAKEYSDIAKEKATQDKISLEENLRQLELAKGQAELEQKQSMKELDELKERQNGEAKENAERAEMLAKIAKSDSDKRFKGLISDLKSDGIIKDDKDLTFSISDKEFIVNGNKQPDEVQERYAKKYNIGQGVKLFYSKKSDGKHSSVSINTVDNNN